MTKRSPNTYKGSNCSNSSKQKKSLRKMCLKRNSLLHPLVLNRFGETRAGLLR